VKLNRPIVPHVRTVATGVYALSISMLRAHRHAQGLGRRVLYSAVRIGPNGQQCTLLVWIPPKFNSEGHPVDTCDPVADPWSTKSPNWEYIWRLPATRDDMQVRVTASCVLAADRAGSVGVNSQSCAHCKRVPQMTVHQALWYENENEEPYPSYDQTGKLWPVWFIQLHRRFLAGRKAVNRQNTAAAASQSAVGTATTGRPTSKRGRRCGTTVVHDAIRSHMLDAVFTHYGCCLMHRLHHFLLQCGQGKHGGVGRRGIKQGDQSSQVCSLL
jgi:hypothetical protein